MTAAAVILAALALAVALSARSHATHALLLAEEHEEALRLAARETSIGALDGATRWPPTWSNEELARLWQAVQRPEAAVVAYCPDCECELQDEAFEFWCPRCEAAVSYARVAAEGA